MAVYNPAHVPIYDMNSHPRGICLIINNMEFKNCSALKTGHADKDKLVKTFAKLDFKVLGDYYFENLTACQMKAKLEEVALLNHSQYDCFVCCINSHGKKAGILGTDGEHVHISELTSPLRASKCESLAGKPKLFFVDACRGGKEQGGIKTQLDNSQRDLEPAPEQDGPIPDEADFLLGYATAEDYIAYEHSDKSKGSRFFSRLTENLDKYAHVHDILEIMTMVNRDVCSDIPHQLQTPAPTFTLRKKLYLGLRNIRVLMVGPSMSGKSSVANAIFGEGKFVVQAQSGSTRKQSDWQHITQNGRRIEVTELAAMGRETEEEFDRELTKSLLVVTPGPHVIFLCYRADLGFSAEDKHYKWLREFLKEDFAKFVVLVLCGQVPAFVDEASSKKAIDMLHARNRKIIFDASIEMQGQQNLILETLDRVVRENAGCSFSNQEIESFHKDMKCLLRERSHADIRRSIVEGNDCGLKCLAKRQPSLFEKLFHGGWKPQIPDKLVLHQVGPVW